MPLRVKKRGNKWVAYGRVELDGVPITGYYHNRSTGSSTETGALEWVQAETTRQKRRYLLGDKEEKITFVMAVMQFDAKPVDAGYLTKVLIARPDFGQMEIDEITGKFIKTMGLEIYPDAATDTVWRQVVTPVRSVINNMHELGKGPYLRVRSFKEKERIDRDIERGKLSREPREASDKGWIEAFCAHADIYNAAMAKFMFETGARIGQAVSIAPNDVDLMKKRVRIKAQKGHAEQWVDISHAMMIELANLPPKCPHNRKMGYKLEPRVFGYATAGGYRKAWTTICGRAGIKTLTAHEAGRHGFGTELLVRQGVDPVTVAKAGRWKSPQMLLETYAHSETSQAEIRERFRTEPVQDETKNPDNYMKRKE